MFVIALSLMVIGITYAMYVYTGTGTKENVITTGEIKVSFEEENNILIKNRYSETDEVGLSSIDPDSQMTFKVSSDIKGEAIVNYAIGLVDINEGDTLKQNYIKINLTKNGETANNFTSGSGKLISSFKNRYVPDYITSHVIATGSVTGVQTDTYTLKAWIDENYDLPKNTNDSNNTHTEGTTSEEFSFKIKVVATDGTIEVKQRSLDESGANTPDLASNMVPVYYDKANNVWKKADSTNVNYDYMWYNYDDRKWANAVTLTNENREDYLNASLGTEIPLDDINTMWVWIPRFNAEMVEGQSGEYTTEYCSDGGYTDASSCTNAGAYWYNDGYYNPGAFDVTFVDVNMTAHDAFTFGNDELAGFWIGKFELSHTTLSSSTSTNNLECQTSTCSNANELKVLPNKRSLSNNDVSNFFYGISSMAQNDNSYGFNSSEVDTHMIKNNEWGAIAYLTQSIYGRCTSSVSCTEVGGNMGNDFVTGYGWSNVSDEKGAYETILGQNASTTGNIYGVYDMNGGLSEYVMGVYTDGVNLWSGNNSTINSGFNGCLGSLCQEEKTDGVSFPISKYYNTYTNTGNREYPVTNYISSMQHALIETESWYGDAFGFVEETAPWFIRGINYTSVLYIVPSARGIFSYYLKNGNEEPIISFTNIFHTLYIECGTRPTLIIT